MVSIGNMFSTAHHTTWLTLVILSFLQALNVTSYRLSINPEHVRLRDNPNTVTIKCTADIALTGCQFTWQDHTGESGPLLELSRGRESRANSSHLDKRITGYRYVGRGLAEGDCGIEMQVKGLKTWMIGCRVRAVLSGWRYAWTDLDADMLGPLPITVSPREAVVFAGKTASFLCRAREELDACSISPPGEFWRDFDEGSLSEDSNGLYLYHGEGLSSGECGLRLVKVMEKNNGPALCSVWTAGESGKATNGHTRYVAVIVARPPTFPLLEVVYNGANLTASCTVGNSRPVATISWMLGEETIRNDADDDAAADLTAEWRWPWVPATITQVLERRLGPGDGGKLIRCIVDHVALDKPMIADRKINFAG